jgi:hypothetical protein
MNGSPASTRSTPPLAQRRQRLEERTLNTGEFRTEAVDDDLAMRETSGRTGALTHWSFGPSRVLKK